MKYCMECGAKLRKKYLDGEGMVPYCDRCGTYRFPVFNTAVSMIVTNRDQTKILLIRQYGRPHYILVAGYVNKGEDAENAAVREVKEEMGLDVIKAHFNHSHYFAPSNTLMLNFTVIVSEEGLCPNREIDSWRWFEREEALRQIKKGSLAGAFLKGFLTGSYSFTEADGLTADELERQKKRKVLHLAMAQMAPGENLNENIAACFRMIEEASGRGADLILFPELPLTRFFPQYRIEEMIGGAAREMDDRDFAGDAGFREKTGLTRTDSDLVRSFCRQCRKYRMMAVTNFYLEDGGKAYQASLLIDSSGEILGKQDRVHIAGKEGFYEKDYFSPSEEKYHVYDTRFGRIGMVTGLDRHYPQAIRTEAEKGAGLILLPAAICSGEPLELYDWEIRVQAFNSRTALALCSRTGQEGKVAFAGGSLLAAADGSLKVKADSEEGLIFAEVDLSDSQGPRFPD